MMDIRLRQTTIHIITQSAIVAIIYRMWSVGNGVDEAAAVAVLDRKKGFKTCAIKNPKAMVIMNGYGRYNTSFGN